MGKPVKKIAFYTFLFIPIACFAQQRDSLISGKDTTQKKSPQTEIVTGVAGRVTDVVTGLPLPFISIVLTNSSHHTNTDSNGEFSLKAQGSFSHVSISYVGYQPTTKYIVPGQLNKLQIKLTKSQTQLNEVLVMAQKGKAYRNKGNPAVEFIRQVINHKDSNKMTSANYLQYDQYERIGLRLFDLPHLLINNGLFKRYQFMLDTTLLANGQKQISLPVYFAEKSYQNFFRKKPYKSIQRLNAQKEINIIKFIDTVGLDIYLNRLYGNNVDIYSNNIFIMTNQFLSPIADHAPDFYKFFITDTLRTDKDSLVVISFIPRTKGDLLFEGKLLVTLDGRYAVRACELNVNKQININFMRSLTIDLDFQKYKDGRYVIAKSNVKADFGILKSKGTGVFGERTVFYSNYVLDTPLDAVFYQGKSLQKAPDFNQPDTNYWLHKRPDTLSKQQAQVYSHINRLEKMKSFKTITWIASTFATNYADVGPVQFAVGNLVSYGSAEGVHIGLSGRTTPKLNKSVYFEWFGGYGTKDKQFKYTFSTYYSLNKTPFYSYPNNYFKVSKVYDISLPGQNFSNSYDQSVLSSFQTGGSQYYLYSNVYKVDYVKEFDNHFSFDIAFKYWDQRPTGALVYSLNDYKHTVINNVTTSEINLALRYAPHEQILQGTNSRTTIYSKYPILTLQIDHGLKGVFNGSFNYSNFTATVVKRFYFSQLGYADVALIGNFLAGKVPFPLLNISPANQSLAYEPNAYNKMYYLEFVSDHYAGINFTQSFNGFFLNKLPLIKYLKWREYLSFKALYGGLRNENNPLYSAGLYNFPSSSGGSNGTYALGSTPYIEAGAGIGNIFKVLRVDMIRRFNYLDHPGISPYGIKFSFNIDF